MDKIVDLNHLKEVKSGYFKHCFLAIYFVLLILLAAIIGLIHAFIPFLFPFTPYLICKNVVNKTEEYFIHSKK